MTRNYLVTGTIGSGKTTIARAVASTMGATVAEFSHASEDLPIPRQGSVVILDEPRAEVVSARISTLKEWMKEGTRLVYVSRDVASTPSEVFPLLTQYGGFHHIQTGVVNSPLAEVEILPLNSSAEMWAVIFDGMREEKRDRSVDRILSDLSAAVADATLSSTVRSALNAKVALLASAVRAGRNNALEAN